MQTVVAVCPEVKYRSGAVQAMFPQCGQRHTADDVSILLWHSVLMGGGGEGGREGGELVKLNEQS